MKPPPLCSRPATPELDQGDVIRKVFLHLQGKKK